MAYVLQKDRPDGISAIRQFSELEPATFSALQDMGRKRRYEAGQTISAEGDPTTFVACVLDGFLRMQKTLADGRQQIVGILVEGDMFGQVFSGPQHFAIEAATDTEICAFPRLPFEKLLTRSPDLDRVLLLNILNELDRARDWMIVLSTQKVCDRLAGFLLVVCSRFATVDHLVTRVGEGLEIRIPISRADLASLLGARAETISRGFHTLEDAGEISIVKPDIIRILDLKALAVRAGEEDYPDPSNLRDMLRSVRQHG